MHFAKGDMDDRQLVRKDDASVSLSGSAVDDGILAELLSMGFDLPAAVTALTAQGVYNLGDAVEFLLAGNHSQCQTGRASSRTVDGHLQSSNVSHLQAFQASTDSVRESRGHCASPASLRKQSLTVDDREFDLGQSMENKIVIGNTPVETLCARAEDLLSTYFGYSKLKPFQMEALEAWANHQDCLVLAATGSGKSLCFQLPALLTGKVTVVISPLISLMHDQCQQLLRRGITACFLGSGQGDKTVEKKAMAGMYSIVYVCPETLPRLVDSLRELASKRGLALFAIDEAHCISKWGHDFRPHYRRLSTLREVFRVQSSLDLQDTVPIMGLTATATDLVQLDIMKSLNIDINKARIVRTTLFRPNLRFSVHHSKTCRPSSYKDDFKVLFDYYIDDSGSFNQDNLGQPCKRPVNMGKMDANASRGDDNLEVFEDEKEWDEVEGEENEKEGSDEVDDGDVDKTEKKTALEASKTAEVKELTVDFLEDDYEDEIERLGGDFEVACNNYSTSRSQSMLGQSSSTRVVHSPSIVYVPTRREAEAVAMFLCQSGLKAAPYHAKLPKVHLQRVHEEFHFGSLQVVVATIAFGMGIDKSDVRHIIHYGWPQSLEAYYQEAGRAGRDGLLSECILYCDMTVLPSLLPSRRDQQQTQHALHMLEQCFRYGLSTTKCRAGTLLEYFGEDLPTGRCKICDVCTKGPPCLENFTLEAEVLLEMISSTKEIYPSVSVQHFSSQRKWHTNSFGNKQAYKHAVEEIAKCNKFPQKNHLWWRGFGRVLADAGFLKDSSPVGNSSRKLIVPQLRNPQVTAEGHKFLATQGTEASVSFFVHPQGDMIQALLEPCMLGGQERAAREWGRGWADPEIRKQRLGRAKFSTRHRRDKRQCRRRDNRRGRKRLKLSA